MARIASTTSAGVPVGPQMTLDALMQRQRELAGNLPSANREMISPWQGAAYLSEVLANRFNQNRIDQQLAEGRQGLASAMSGVSMDAGPTADQIAQVSQYDPDMGMQLWRMSAEMMQARRQREQELADAATQRQQQLGDRDLQWAHETTIRKEERADELADAAAKAAADAAKPMSPEGQIMRDFNAGLYGDPATPEAQARRDAALAPKSGVTINTGDTSSALTKKFDEAEGTAWSGYLAAGTKAAALRNDMQLLDELGKIAPQGPLPGAIQKLFPGVSSAGAAYTSIIKRLAPQMRVEGSGATSDIEYKGMVDSLQSLSNYPEANQLIGGMIKAKAAIDIERAGIVTAWRNRQLDDAGARAALQQLNQRSIMSPELARLIAATQQQSSAPGAVPGATGEESVDDIIRRNSGGG